MLFQKRMIPKTYWLTSGVGESDYSPLVAKDKAFIRAGIGNQNHVIVSSIPPVIEAKVKIDPEKGITAIQQPDGSFRTIPNSTIIHVVRALKVGKEGERISACIALCKVKLSIDGKTEPCLLAYENTGNSLEETVNGALQGVKELANNRNVEIDKEWGENGFKVVTATLTVSKAFGCAAAFVVLEPNLT